MHYARRPPAQGMCMLAGERVRATPARTGDVHARRGARVEAGAVRLWNGGGELVQIDAAIIARVNACKNLKELEVSERG